MRGQRAVDITDIEVDLPQQPSAVIATIGNILNGLARQAVGQRRAVPSFEAAHNSASFRTKSRIISVIADFICKPNVLPLAKIITGSGWPPIAHALPRLATSARSPGG